VDGEVRIPDLTDMDHRAHGGGDIPVPAQPDGGVDGRPQARRLMRVDAGDRQTEDIRRELDRGRALGSTAGQTQPTGLDLRPAGRPLQPIAQGIGQSLEDRQIDVGAGVDVAEADDRPLGLRSRDAHAG
jgi:hypothetical protein